MKDTQTTCLFSDRKFLTHHFCRWYCPFYVSGFGYTNIQNGMMREATIKREPLRCLCDSFWCNCQKIICPTSKHTERTTSDSWSRSNSQGDLNGPFFRHASAPPPEPHFLSACASWQRSHHIKCHPKPIIHKWKCLTRALPPLRGAHGLPSHMRHHLCLSWEDFFLPDWNLFKLSLWPPMKVYTA